MKLRKAAYTVEAIIDAGVPAAVARTLVADDPEGREERPLVKVGGRRREAATTRYIWGPDAMTLLSEMMETKEALV